MAERKYDDFDKFAYEYRQKHTKNIQKISGVDSDYFSEYKVREVLKRENNIIDKVILDFGCGDGNSAPYFLKYLAPCLYYGLDICGKSIKIAKQRRLERCYFQTFDGEKIPFEDNSFDIIFIAGVLHHINSKYHKNIIRECHRVLKKEGRIYIFEHNPINPLTQKIVHDCEFDIDAELISSNDINNIMKEAGFIDFALRYTIFFPRKFPFRMLIPYEDVLWWCPLGGQYYIRCVKKVF